jgi:hypothetical protein
MDWLSYLERTSGDKTVNKVLLGKPDGRITSRKAIINPLAPEFSFKF